MNAGVRLAGAVLLASIVTACAGEVSSNDEASPHEARPCDAGFTTPEGFRQTERFLDPYPDHVGIRLGFVSDDGRELHYFAGIPGEFGEGLPPAGTVAVAQDLEGPLQGSEGTWVLSWKAPGPCGERAVLGTGFTRSSFLATLERAAIVPHGERRSGRMPASGRSALAPRQGGRAPPSGRADERYHRRPWGSSAVIRS